MSVVSPVSVLGTVPPKDRRLPYIRWACLTGVLIVEMSALTLRFDTETLGQESGWWAAWLGQSHLIPRLAIGMAAGTLVLGGARLRAELQRQSAALDRPGWWVFLLPHLAAFAGFAWLTEFVLEGGAAASGHPEIWAVTWGGLGLVVAIFWVAAAVSPIVWIPLLKRTAAPLAIGAIGGTAAWLVGGWTAELWRPFHHATFWLVRELLARTGADLVCEPSQALVGTTAFSVVIAPACSGYEGIGLIAVFLSGYLWLFRRRLRFPAVLVLLPLGAAAMWLLNAVRIAALVLIGSWASPEVARGGFHSQAGWLIFNGVALTLVALSGRLRFFQTHEPIPLPAPRTDTAAYLAPLCAILAATMLTRAVSGDERNWLYPLRVMAALAVLWHYRNHYATPRRNWSPGAVGLGVLAFLIWLALVPVAAETDRGAALAELPTSEAAFWLFFRVLGAVVTVPVAEELAFRGFLLRRLTAADFESVAAGRFSWFAFLASSALFAALHSSWLAGMAAGMIYGLSFYRRRRVADAILSHAVTNALLAVHVLVTGQWSLWS